MLPPIVRPRPHLQAHGVDCPRQIADFVFRVEPDLRVRSPSAISWMTRRLPEGAGDQFCHGDVHQERQQDGDGEGDEQGLDNEANVAPADACCCRLSCCS